MLLVIVKMKSWTPNLRDTVGKGQQWVKDNNRIEDKLEEDDRDKKQSKLQDSEESMVSSETRTIIDGW